MRATSLFCWLFLISSLSGCNAVLGLSDYNVGTKPTTPDATVDSQPDTSVVETDSSFVDVQPEVVDSFVEAAADADAKVDSPPDGPPLLTKCQSLIGGKKTFPLAGKNNDWILLPWAEQERVLALARQRDVGKNSLAFSILRASSPFGVENTQYLGVDLYPRLLNYTTYAQEVFVLTNQLTSADAGTGDELGVYRLRKNESPVYIRMGAFPNVHETKLVVASTSHFIAIGIEETGSGGINKKLRFGRSKGGAPFASLQDIVALNDRVEFSAVYANNALYVLVGSEKQFSSQKFSIYKITDDDKVSTPRVLPENVGFAAFEKTQSNHIGVMVVPLNSSGQVDGLRIGTVEENKLESFVVSDIPKIDEVNPSTDINATTSPSSLGNHLGFIGRGTTPAVYDTLQGIAIKFLGSKLSLRATMDKADPGYIIAGDEISAASIFSFLETDFRLAVKWQEVSTSTLDAGPDANIDRVYINSFGCSP